MWALFKKWYLKLLLSRKMTNRTSLFVFCVLVSCALRSPAALGQRGRVHERPQEHISKTKPPEPRDVREARDQREYTLSAKENHSNLRRSYKRNAREWIYELSASNLAAHIRGLTDKEQEQTWDINILQSFLKEGMNFPAVRDAYWRKIERMIDEENLKIVKDMSSGQLKLLFDFAQKKGVREPNLAKLNSTVIEEWFEAAREEKQYFAKEFPLVEISDTNNRRLQPLLESATSEGYQHGSDGHNYRYKNEAFREFLSKNVSYSRFGANKWKFRASGFEQVWKIMEQLDAPLPGEIPEVVYFLDPAVAKGAVDEMSQSWNNGSRRPPRFLEHSDVDLMLSEFSGKTLLLVGHMEHRQFVMDRGGGQIPLKMDIPYLIEAAQRRGVFLIPIGCNSASEGAFFGFTRPILSGEVATLFASIPRNQMKVGDLLSAFNAIGSISIDAARMNQFLEITVHKTVRTNGESSEVAISVFRLPTSSNGNFSSFSAYYSDWEAKRPFVDRGVSRYWRENYRDSPRSTLLVTGIGFILALTSWNWIRSNVFVRRRLITRVERNFQILLGVLAGVFILSSGVRLLIVIWPLILFVFGAAILFALGSMLFEPVEKKNKVI
jgi:hypothetical protein